MAKVRKLHTGLGGGGKSLKHAALKFAGLLTGVGNSLEHCAMQRPAVEIIWRNYCAIFDTKPVVSRHNCCKKSWVRVYNF